MPSLNALGEFKSSFHDIANEREGVRERKLPFTDLPLPTTEPPPFDPALRESANVAGDFDYDSFFESLSGEASQPAPEDAFEETVPPLDTGLSDDVFSAMDSFLGDMGGAPSPDEPSPLDGLLDDTDALSGGEPSPLDGLLDDTDALSGGEPSPLDGLLDDTDALSGGEPSPLDGLLDDTDALSGGEPSPLDGLLDDTDALSGGEPSPLDGLLDDTDALSGGEPSPLDGLLDDTGSPPEGDDFSVPDGLLSGLSEEIESAPSDFGAEEPVSDDLDLGSLGIGDESEESAPEQGEEALGDFDLSSLTGDAPAAEEEAPPEDDIPAEEEDIDLGGGIDLGGETLDLGGESPAIDASEEAPAAADDAFDLGDMPGMGEEAPLPADDAFDLGDMPGMGEEAPLPADDAFDLGDMPGMGEETPLPADDAFDLGDMPGMGEEAPLPADDAFDLGDMPGMGEEAPLPADDAFDLGDMPGMGEEAPALADDAFDLGDMPGMAEEAPPPSKKPPAPAPSEDASDLGENVLDLGGESLGGEAASDDFSVPDDLLSGVSQADGADSSAGDAGFDNSDMDFSSGADDIGSTFDIADLGSEFATGLIDLDGAHEAGGSEDFDSGSFGGGESFGGDDDFELPDLGDIFEKTKVAPLPKPVEKKSLFGKKKQKTEDIGETETGSDEISLTQGQVNRLLKTLSTFPLNLRIACEELIAEQVILPQQLSKLVRYLVNGASVRETAALVEEITGKPIIIPRGFEKMTGAAFQAEQASFAYIFVHNFLPVLRLFAIIAAFIASVIYLGYKFVYTPLKAESIYKRGYERIPVGEYQRANELFHDAFVLHRKKKWFYLYAEAFRDQRRYMLAEGKYDELLRYYPRDKKGVLDYANLETYYLMNYDKANGLLQRQLLDYAPNDFDGLLAAGDNFLLWADSDPSKNYDRYEDARFSYARLLERYGWQPPIVERMMKYFIRIDNLGETLKLRVWFENDPKRRLSAESLAELGGYLLDKQLEVVKGVPNPYLESIESVRAMLLQAVGLKPELPEPHYHLARYHKNLNNTYEERLTLENAIRAFNLAENTQPDSVRRRRYRVDAHYRYANLLTNNREFFPAEEQLVRGIELYEDFLNRNLISASPDLGRLYAAKGDLEYYTKTNDRQAAESALEDYRRAEVYGYAPPEMQYRMGSAYYQLEEWANALQYLFSASSELPLNRRMLFALGNITYQRGDYFAAQGYYDRLLDILENQRVRLPVLLPNDTIQFQELGERLMMARNNAGVVYQALAEQTGNREYRSRAMALYAESSRAWDSISRNPETMVRRRPVETEGAPSINLGYLNAYNAMRPRSQYTPEIFPRIDKDVIEPSRWEELAPVGGLIN